MTETKFQCGLEAVLEILGGKWKPLILYHLAGGAKRTGQLRRLVTNVSEKMLIQHLKEMVDDGITLPRSQRSSKTGNTHQRLHTGPRPAGVTGVRFEKSDPASGQA